KDHNRRRAAERRFAEHLARLDAGDVQAADRQHRGLEHAVFRVQQHDAELLHRARSELRHQVERGIPGRAELTARARAMRYRAPAELDGSKDRSRLRRADAWRTGELAAGGPGEAVETAARREEIVGDRQRAGMTKAAAQDRRQQLVVAEGGGAVTRELLARTI